MLPNPCVHNISLPLPKVGSGAQERQPTWERKIGASLSIPLLITFGAGQSGLSRGRLCQPSPLRASLIACCRENTRENEGVVTGAERWFFSPVNSTGIGTQSHPCWEAARDLTL